MPDGKPTAAFHSLGCKVNAYETEAMQQQLQEAGYDIVPFAPGADVYVINTCTVTGMADRKSRQMLHRAKKMNPEAIVVAVGCYVQTAAEKTHLSIEADIVLGNNRKGELAEAIREYRQTGESRFITGSSTHRDYEKLQIRFSGNHTRAFIKVQDGCNQFCSYCLIPFARGRERSRDPEEVAREVGELCARGTREVVLTGIHLSAYGKDLDGQTSLAELAAQLSQVEGIRRIRLGSLEPVALTEEFVTKIAEIPQICPHFHLSLQSGSDAVLARMNRHYGAEELREVCRRLRRSFEDPALTADVIVGFPGETEEEFAQTEALLKEIRLSRAHIFKFSPREGTRAASMADQVPEEVKTRRSAILLALGKQCELEYEERHAGKTAELLVEEMVTLDGRSFAAGHTREYISALTADSTAAPGMLLPVTLGRLDRPAGDIRMMAHRCFAEEGD